MKLQSLATLLNVELECGEILYNKISSDTRTLQPGDVYIAFAGDQYDGHDYVAAAEAAGAVAIIAHKTIQTKLPILNVTDTRSAYMRVAALYRQSMPAKVIAITGSCGKTTTRALLQSIFSPVVSTHASINSYNNDIGVSHTLLNLEQKHQFLIAEVGTNAPGEIALLSKMLHPDVAIITNVTEAHLQGFDDMQHYAAEKAAIIGEAAADGCVILNADDTYYNFWRQCSGSRRVVSFSCQKPADITAINIAIDSNGCASFEIPELNIFIRLQLMGRHNVANALAAAAAAWVMGLTPLQIQQGLENAQPESKRLMIQMGLNSTRIINDTYNANPLSTRAAIDVLCSMPGNHVLVFADMGELGAQSMRLHQEIGAYARAAGVSKLFTYGTLSKAAAVSFGGMAQHFSHQKALVQALLPCLGEQSVILIKGSRAMKMERVVQALQET